MFNNLLVILISCTKLHNCWVRAALSGFTLEMHPEKVPLTAHTEGILVLRCRSAVILVTEGKRTVSTVYSSGQTLLPTFICRL